MERYIGLFIGGIILFYSEIYVWAKFYDEKINYKNPWFYISIFFLTLLSIFNHIFVNAFIKVLFITILMCVSNWLIFKRRINEIIVSVIYGQFLVAFADIIFALIFVVLFKMDSYFVKNTFADTFIGNAGVSLIYVLICSIPIVKKIYLKLVKMTDRFKIRSLVLLFLLIILSIDFLVAVNFYNIKSIYVIIINAIMILIYSFIVYKAINERNVNDKIKSENALLIQNLNQYEDMVDRQRVDNHENKNQLLIIKNMIKKKDKDVIKYIDTIVKDEKEDDEALYTKVKNIPSGGLQGIIYQKMLTMKDKKILFSLDVGLEVRKINLDNLSMDDTYKLCKMVGVLLDNAIEESLKIDDKRIMICLYVDDDKLVIDISNKFSEKIDLEKIDEAGYTTKGDGHGYGLSLIKKIVSSSILFENDRKINKDVFKQIVRVRVK